MIWLKVLSYWNLNAGQKFFNFNKIKLKVLSYWNLNAKSIAKAVTPSALKVLSYWNLNGLRSIYLSQLFDLKYYHIGI